MKYAFICASAEPTYCGPGKFSAKLTRLLQNHDAEVVYLTSEYQRDYHAASAQLSVTPEKGRLLEGGVLDVFKFVRKHRPDIVNIQYQSFHQNYADIFYPLAAKLAHPKTKTIATIHEFEHFSLLGRLRQVLPMLTSSRILFSDRRQMVKALPYTLQLVRRKSSVIAVGPSVKPQLKTYARQFTHNPKHLHLAFHGFVQPLKGLEYLLEALARFEHPFTLHLIGKLTPILEYNIHDSVTEYQRQIQRQIETSPRLKKNVRIYGDIDPNSARFVEILSRTELAVFPFRDGVSHRRSSLMNTLMNTNALVAATYDEKYSDSELDSILPLEYSSKAILDFLRDYITWDNARYQAVYSRQRALKEYFLSEKFQESLYRQLILDSNRENVGGVN